MNRLYYIITIMLILISSVSCENAKIPETVRQESTGVSIEREAKPFANPALIYGTDFLSFLSALKINSPGNIEALLKFTSEQSLNKHSRKDILNLYEKTNINFSKKLKAIRQENDTLFILNYVAFKYATKSVITCTVSVERDTCRLMLPDNLNEFLN